MSLNATKTFYNFIIDMMIKEIAQDPEMNNISSQALDYLQTTWRNKLEASGVYTPNDNTNKINPVASYGNPLTYPNPSYLLFSQNLMNIAIKTEPEQPDLPEPINTVTTANPIIQKQESSSSSDVQKGFNDENNCPSDKEEKSQENEEDLISREEEKEINREELAIKNEDQDEDYTQYFEYQRPEETSQPKSTMNNALIKKPSTVALKKIKLNDLDPYNPQDKPIDSDDDVEEYVLDATNILVCLREKGHRSKSKWKQTLTQGILCLRGKEYILSQVECNLEFKYS